MRLSAGLAVALVACASDTASIATGELVVDFHVIRPEAGAGTTHYEATFAKDTRFQKLDEGDEIRVTTDAAPPAVLVSDENPLGVTYALDRADPPLGRATFVLTRKAGSAPASTVVFPAPLADFVPAEGATIPYGDGTGTLLMKWSNKIENGVVSLLNQPCDRDLGRIASKPVPDTGAITLDLKALAIEAPSKPTCIRVFVRRGARGTLDPALTMPGSSVTGYLEHVTRVTVTP